MLRIFFVVSIVGFFAFSSFSEAIRTFEIQYGKNKEVLEKVDEKSNRFFYCFQKNPKEIFQVSKTLFIRSSQNIDFDYLNEVIGEKNINFIETRKKSNEAFVCLTSKVDPVKFVYKLQQKKIFEVVEPEFEMVAVRDVIEPKAQEHF